MARIPDVTAFGARPVGAVARPIAGADASAIGDGMADVGRAVRAFGERRADRDADIELALARSAFLRENLTAQQETPQQGDWRTWERSYGERMVAARTKIAGGLRDNRAQQRFGFEADDDIVRGRLRIAADAKRREVDEGRASLDELISGDIDMAVGIEDASLRRRALANVGDAITAAEGKGYLTAQEAVTLRRQASVGYAERRLTMLPAPARLAAVGRSAGGLPPAIDALIAAAGGADAPVLRRIAMLESAGDPSAVNPSGASGLFQFMPATAAETGLANPFDPEASAVAAAKLLRRNRAHLSASLGRAPDGAELYLAHQQGAAGATALMGDPDANVVDALATAYGGDRRRATAAVVQNGGRTTMTAGAFADLWRRKYDAAASVDVADAGPDRSLVSVLPADKIARIAEGAQREVDQAAAQAERAYAADFSDFVRAVETGADIDPAVSVRFSDAALNALVPDPATRRLYRETRDDALLSADASRRLRGASPDEIAALAHEFGSRVDGEVYDAAGLALAPSRAQADAAFQKAVVADWKARTDDPAAYAAATPAVALAAQGLGDGGEDAYARATLAEQDRLNVPEHAQKILSVAMAKERAAEINALQPQDVGPVLARMAQEWGPHFDRVRDELEGNGLHPEAAVAALYVTDPVTAQAVASVAGVKRATLKKGLDPTVPTDVRVLLSAGMEDFRRAFTMGDGSGVAQQRFASLFDIAERMALQEVARTADPADAVERTFNRLVGNVYEVIETGSIMAYVPRGVDVASVEDAAEALIDPARLATADLEALGSLMGAPEAVREARALTAARRGTWITNDAGDGLVLVMDMGDGSVLPVRTRDGQPYGFRFADAPGLAVRSEPEFISP